MSEEELQELEQLFFEQNFEYCDDDDKETIQQNISIARNMYLKAYQDMEKVVECLSDGVSFDQYEAILAVQILEISHRFIIRFEELLRRDGV